MSKKHKRGHAHHHAPDCRGAGYLDFDVTAGTFTVFPCCDVFERHMCACAKKCGLVVDSPQEANLCQPQQKN